MVKLMSLKKKKKPIPPKFEIIAKRTTELGRYQTALYKWLKVIFWHYDELESEINELKKTVKFLSKEIEKLKKRIK